MNILSGNFPPRGGGKVTRISFGADIQDMRPRINHFLINEMVCAMQLVRNSKLIRMLEDVCDLLRAPFFQLLLLLYFLNICFVFHQIRDVERCVCLVQSLLLTALQTGIKWPMSFFGSSACCQRIYILQICNYPATVRKIYFECSMFSNMLSNNLL